MLPHLHQFTDPPMQTNQAAIRTFWNGQLYLVVGDQEAEGQWLLRMWWKPFVTLIWLGGAMIALGGILSLLGRVRRDLSGMRQPEAHARRPAVEDLLEDTLVGNNRTLLAGSVECCFSHCLPPSSAPRSPASRAPGMAGSSRIPAIQIAGAQQCSAGLPPYHRKGSRSPLAGGRALPCGGSTREHPDSAGRPKS